MNKSILILILSFLAVTNVAAQDALHPYAGNTHTYQVNDHTNSSYEWRIYDQLNPLVETNASNYSFETVNNLHTIDIKWETPGRYYLLVTENDLSGCTNTKALVVEVLEILNKVATINTSSNQCYSASPNDVTINLLFFDDNNDPLPDTDFPITVNYTLNGSTQTAQSVSFADQFLTISGTSLNSSPGSDTDNTIIITGATDNNNLTIQPVTDAGQNTHIHTIFRELVTPTVTALNTNSNTPVISGTANVGVNETFNIQVNGITYTPGDGNLTLSGTDWNLTIPASNTLSEGTYPVIATISNASCSITDASDNELVIDTTPPAVDIQNEPVAVNNTTPYTVTFEFSEDVSGFIIEDITVGNGSVSNFIIIDGNTYTADITPDGNGDITIDINTGVAKDLSNNDNIAANQAITLYDITPPTVDIQNEPAIVNNTDPYTVIFEFSEDVSGFTIEDITVGNGSASNFVIIDGNTYTADITPAGNGNITIDVAAGQAKDAGNNDNTAATQAVTIFENNAPTPADDLLTTIEINSISGNMLSNDTDPENDLISLVSVSGETNPSNNISGNYGILDWNSNGSFVYIPNAELDSLDSNESVIEEISYIVTDNFGNEATAKIIITITGQQNTITVSLNSFCNNDLPYVSYTVTTNFTNTGTLTVRWFDSQTNIVAEDSGLSLSGTLLWPGAEFDTSGNATDWPGWIFTDGRWVEGNDGFENTVPQATIEFSVNPTESYTVLYPPITTDCAAAPALIAVADNANTIKNIPVTIPVLDNDSGIPSGSTVSTTSATSENGGTLVVNSDGTITYTPASDFTGTDQFTYEVCDNSSPQRCSSAEVSITVDEGNRPPLTETDNYSINNEPSITDDLSLNDSDPDGDKLTYETTPVSGPSRGTVQINADGTFIYTPDTGANGTDQFVYRVCDDNILGSLCSEDTVNITFINNPPVAEADVFNIEKNKELAGSLGNNDSDPDQDNLIYNTTPTVDVSHGSVIINSDGTFIYTPDADYIGSDTFTYTVCDDRIPSACSEAQVTINVISVNHAPVAINDINNTLINLAVSGNVLTNDYDIDGDPIAAITSLYVIPSNGTVILQSNGTYTYTPTSGFEGEDIFMYVVCETGTNPVLCDTATVTIEVRSDVITNRAPVANEDEIITTMNNPVSGNMLLNDFDPDLNNFTISRISSNVKNGSLTFNPNGSYTYTPADGFTGTDYFVYEICDDANPSLCAQATVSITVIQPEEGNNPPFAADDAVFTTGTPISGDVSKNDFDPDGDDLTYTIVNNPQKGSVIVNPDGTYIYTPNPGAVSGTDQFVYQVCDNGTPAMCSKATVYLTMIINNAPVATDDNLFSLPNETQTGNLLANDFDPDGHTITINTSPVSGPQNGSISINSDGSYTYTPNSDFTGSDIVTYEICDNGIPVKCSQAQLNITVQDISSKDRRATNDINTTIQNQSVTGNVLTNDDDYYEANSITTLYTQPLHGTVILNQDGAYTYTPDNDYIGKDNFDYIVCTDDPPADCDTMNVTIIIQAAEIVNGPVANDDETETTVGVAVTSNLLSNDYSPSGEPMVLNILPISGPSSGTVVISPEGVYTYTPADGFTGTDQFVYELCGLITEVCSTATVTISVDEEIDNRIFAADDALFTYGEEVSGNVLTNDIYPDAATLRLNLTPINPPSHGSVTMNADGTFTYTPDNEFVGTDHFVYEICDTSSGVCDNATVTITVLPAPDLYADLRITKTITPVVHIDEEIVIELLVSNLGNSQATNVRIGDYLPGYIENARYAIESTNVNNNWPGILNIGNLDVDQSVIVYIKGFVRASAPDTIVNYASVGSNTWDPDFNNNISIAKTEVSRKPLIVIAGGNLISIGCCNTQGVTIDASQTTGETSLRFKWNPTLYLDDPTSATPHFTPGESTDYTLTVTDDNGLSSTETVSVQIVECPDAVTDQNVFVETPNTTLIADGSESTGAGITYRWWTFDGIILSGETNSTAQISGLGKYYLEVTDSYGCSDIDSLIVGLYVQAINDTVEMDLNTSVNINVATNDIPQGALDPSSINITVPPDHGSAIVIADSLISYTPDQYYAGTDDFIYIICDYFQNCDEATVLVIINDEELFIPDAFSPNGDGTNDLFEIQGISKYSRVEIEIINRWGSKVYTSKNYGLGEGRDGYWDGTANAGVRVGQGPVPTGTYYYIIQFDDGKRVSGSVYLDR